MDTDSGTRLIAELFAAVEARVERLRSERPRTLAPDLAYLEAYEGALISALLLLKSRAQIGRLDLDALGMAAFDPLRDQDAIDPAVGRRPDRGLNSTAPLNRAEAPLFSPSEYLDVVLVTLKEFAQAARQRITTVNDDPIVDEAYAQALEDVAALVQEARSKAELDG